MQQAMIEWCIAPPSWHPPPTPSAIPASPASLPHSHVHIQ